MSQLNRREQIATELLSAMLKNPEVTAAFSDLEESGHEFANIVISLTDTLLVKLDGTDPGQDPSKVNLE